MAHLVWAKQPFRDVNLRVTNDAYTFSSPSSPDAPSLVLDRPTGDIRLVPGAAGASKRATRTCTIAGILGVVQLRLDKYAIVITKAEPVGRLKGHMVYKVASTELLPMRERAMHDPDEDSFITLLEGFLSASALYFSYTIDVTNSFQRQSQADTSRPLWMRADDRFFFNKHLQSGLVAFREAGSRGHPGPQAGIDAYILPVIMGMVEMRPTQFKGTPLTLVLISRRSRHRGGTRYFSRGIDADGHAANYNETEQVVILNDRGGGYAGGGGATKDQARERQVLSYVQTRGSVPTFWVEVNTLKYTPRIQVRSTEAALAASTRHFAEQTAIYGDNYLVNLVNSGGRECAVKESYEKMAQALAPSLQSLHYVYFDYHSETRGMQMQRAHAIVDRLRDAIDAQGYFRGADMPADPDGCSTDARRLQTSVMRTNCMDCLDRTNVVQSIFARHALDRQLADVGLLPAGASFAADDPALDFLFRNLWADNADCISRAYAGTGAMKTDVTRTGRPTRMGRLQDGRIGVTRYYLNNFTDGPRQDAFDLFLGAYRPAEMDLGSSPVFVDRRPVLIQSIPYLLGFSLFLLLLSMLSRRDPEASLIPIRLFMLLWSAVASWCLHFVWTHGMLFVNWPRLNPLPYAVDGFSEHYAKARKDVLIGSLVAKHERGLSTARYLNAEEGKKRIE